MNFIPASRRSRLVAAAGASGVIAALAFGAAASAHGTHGSPAGGDEGGRAKHVLLISVDGLHQTDLDWYVKHHPTSALASLVAGGVQFSGARTPVPSDSYPGIVGQITGGNPRSTGIWYDDSYNHALLPAGTTSCAGVAPGVEVTYMEAADKDPTALDAGQGLSGLPDSILNMTANATSVLDPKQLPVDPTTCTPVYPHSYLKVNTIFEVARSAGLRTAWSDFAKRYLLAHDGTGNDINGNAKAYTASGLRQAFAGREAAAYFGVPVGDARRPDVFGIARYGTVYTGKQGKIAEHGGANPQDVSVPLVVSGGLVSRRGTAGEPVETTQIAPTILQLLGLDPRALQSVQIEHTQALPVRARD
jgi:hypothetical protein